MPEVTCESTARPQRGGWSGLAFWILATAGLVFFALGVLARPYVQRLEMREQLAMEEAKSQQVRQAMDDLQVVRDTLATDPKGLARQIRRDLGYRRPGEEPLPLEPQALAPPLEELAPQTPPETRLDRVCRTFAVPFVSHASLAGGLMMIAVAFVCFTIPTLRRSGSAGGNLPS